MAEENWWIKKKKRKKNRWRRDAVQEKSIISDWSSRNLSASGLDKKTGDKRNARWLARWQIRRRESTAQNVQAQFFKAMSPKALIIILFKYSVK